MSREIPPGGYPVETQASLFESPGPRFDEHVYAGTTPRVRGSGTSEEAGDSVEDEAPTLRENVYRYLEGSGPSTDEEIEAGLGLRHQTASARRRELVLSGLVVDSEERRKTSSGRYAAVWRVATDREARAYKAAKEERESREQRRRERLLALLRDLQEGRTSRSDTADEIALLFSRQSTS